MFPPTDDLGKLLAAVVALECPICMAGTVANILNIIVFSRMNLNQTVNISLLALAVADLFSLVGKLWNFLLYFLFLASADLPFIAQEIYTMKGSWTHEVFTSISGLLTLLVGLERCLCIALPLKIKTIATTPRIKTTIVLMYVLIIGFTSVSFVNYQFAWKFNPLTNQTKLGIMINQSGWDTDPFTVLLTASQYAVVFGIALTTIILLVKLRQRLKWRKTIGQANETTESTRRDTRVIQTVCLITGIFTICYLPDSINITVRLIVPGYIPYDRYHNLYVIFTTLVSLLQSINASVNIFIYWRFTASFKEEVKMLFGRSK